MPASRPAAGRIFSVLLRFVKKNTVLCIAFVIAAASMFFVPPDEQYAGYFDLKTLCCLFTTLAVVCALKNIHFFGILAARIIRMTGSTRIAALTLIVITFTGSMLIANDMALITFLPLGFLVFSTTGRREDMATVFILQNIAANLGGMLTPFGNPQNLYLYARFNIPTMEFLSIMAVPFAVSVVLMCLCCFLITRQSMRIVDTSGDEKLPAGRAALYLTLFAMTILMVFRLLPPVLVLVIVTATLLIADRKALREVDYGLLGTFVCFFIFAGNIARIGAVEQFFSGLLEKSTLLTTVFSCQCISNVPSSILLSRFTENYPSLLIGVNIGGAGTLIASLASLITFREYMSHYPGTAGKYIARFSLLNFSFLGILIVLSLSLGY